MVTNLTSLNETIPIMHLDIDNSLKYSEQQSTLTFTTINFMHHKNRLNISY